MKMIAVLFLIHGLISAGQSFMGFKPTAGVPNPAWMSWWPANLGQSWLFQQAGLTGRSAYAVTGALWVVVGIGFVAAAIMLFTTPARPGWAPLAAGAAILSLLLLGIYAHPWYAGAVALNLAAITATIIVSQPR